MIFQHFAVQLYNFSKITIGSFQGYNCLPKVIKTVMQTFVRKLINYTSKRSLSVFEMLLC